MNAINEAELTDFIKNKAVKRLNIVQNENGKYQIVITLTWKEGDWNLETTRGKIREWASLDRMALHIREKYEGALPPISLTLFK
jgi:predicted transglutaminase-like cysteine proteinase